MHGSATSTAEDGARGAGTWPPDLVTGGPDL
jgi:hypothetical protein